MLRSILCTTYTSYVVLVSEIIHIASKRSCPFQRRSRLSVLCGIQIAVWLQKIGMENLCRCEIKSLRKESNCPIKPMGRPLPSGAGISDSVWRVHNESSPVCWLPGSMSQRYPQFARH